MSNNWKSWLDAFLNPKTDQKEEEKGGTRMFRKMTDKQRELLNLSLEHHKVLETHPYPCEKDGKRYVIVVFDIEDDGDCVKKDFGLLDLEGIPIHLPFRVSPYSGRNQIIKWLEAGRPNDSRFDIKLHGSLRKKIQNDIQEEYGNGPKDN